MIFKYFGGYIEDAKKSFAKAIEVNIEATLEKERNDGYADGTRTYSDKLECMTAQQKETMRLDAMRMLETQKQKIVSLWDNYIDKTIMFSVWIDVYIRVGIIVSVIMLLMKIYLISAIFFFAALVLIVISNVAVLHNNICYFFTGSKKCFEELDNAYYRYGKLEAKLHLADHRGLSRNRREQKFWVYTTSHEKAPLE